MFYVITVAFCPAAQLARGFLKYQTIPRHRIVVLGHYPINKKKNNRDIQMLCDEFGVPCWDPGSDLGSAQSQNWALERLNPDDKDYWINLDPDSNCPEDDWDFKMLAHIRNKPDCVAISCWSRMWEPFRNRLEIKDNFGKAINPTPFNLTMFRCSFIKQIGGLRQLGEKWGELEAVFHAECVKHDKYHAYLMDCVEEESGKYMQDRQLLEYKDAYLRTNGPERFVGTYEEFLKWKYPELLAMDTYIEENTEFQ